MSIAFRIYGKSKRESAWRIITVTASHARDMCSRWPVVAGTCIAWSSGVIAVGWDFAEQLLREQQASPASRESPVSIPGGWWQYRGQRRQTCSFPPLSNSEILAHECGHTYQALRLGPSYWLMGALFTWWGEGPNWWNDFENQASELGQFGGIIQNSIHPALWTSDRTVAG
jgi:hypothetical protein